MSNSGNIYRPRGPTTADLSKLPAHIKDAVEQEVAWRDGEVGVLASCYLKPATRPGARVFTTTAKNHAEDEMVVMRVLDYTGRTDIARLEITPADLPTLLKGLIGIYKAQGGAVGALLEMYEGK